MGERRARTHTRAKGTPPSLASLALPRNLGHRAMARRGIPPTVHGMNPDEGAREASREWEIVDVARFLDPRLNRGARLKVDRHASRGLPHKFLDDHSPKLIRRDRLR